MSARPVDEKELQKREALGVIRASRFVRKLANSKSVLNVGLIENIHAVIFQDSWPEVAGQWRVENLKITDSSHLPPHFSEVPRLMREAGVNLASRISSLRTLAGLFAGNEEPTEQQQNLLDDVVTAAAWTHHAITYVHPFREGNGRTARLAANLVLERYGLLGISIKIERENKNRYLQALKQIDRQSDYEPLKALIYEGLDDRYSGISKNIFI